MLTKDENMINAKFAVQYKINDAQKYLFNVANPELTLRQVVESAIRQVVGKSANVDLERFLLERHQNAISPLFQQGQ
jgi:membrane protease subunit HflK